MRRRVKSRPAVGGRGGRNVSPNPHDPWHYKLGREKGSCPGMSPFPSAHTYPDVRMYPKNPSFICPFLYASQPPSHSSHPRHVRSIHFPAADSPNPKKDKMPLYRAVEKMRSRNKENKNEKGKMASNKTRNSTLEQIDVSVLPGHVPLDLE